MGETIKDTVVTDLVEPGLGGDGMGAKYVNGMLVKNISWEPTDHSKEAELLQMEKCSSGKTSSEKEYHCSWSTR